MESPFMRIPAELRLAIYSYLFDAGETVANTDNEGVCPDTGINSRPNNGKPKTISIRNRRDTTTFQRRKCCEHSQPQRPQSSSPTRSRYQIMERSFRRRRVETTYCLENKGAYFCTALMRVNRAVWAETAHLVYAGHEFDFGPDVEAPRPFLSDLTPETRGLVKRIAIYKRGPWLFDSWSDRCEWQTMCAYLCENLSVEHLRLVVQAGQVEDQGWYSKGEANRTHPRELSSTDIALLVDIRHDTLDWVGDLVRFNKLRELEIVPDFCTVPSPQTSNMFLFMAFSASIDKGFKEFLRRRLGLD
ncbi:hypothetical protein F5Y09DRAFT_197175 [Xylaria sp. FL1042]|nr:hypothetical protein F5Y09DRAFT_197175 [Xylaria sp. FL1042]